MKIEEPLKAQEFEQILKVHESTSQREVYEYVDQDVTKILVHWKISFDDDEEHNNTLWVVLKGRGMLGISYMLLMQPPSILRTDNQLANLSGLLGLPAAPYFDFSYLPCTPPLPLGLTTSQPTFLTS